MRLEQIDHIALRCASPESSKSWYVDTLGFEHVFPGQWAGIPIFLRLGSTFLALFPQATSQRTSAHAQVPHLAFRATTYVDFQCAMDDLRARGVAYHFQDHEISHSIYFSDPDGFQLEITTYDVAENERIPNPA